MSGTRTEPSATAVANSAATSNSSNTSGIMLYPSLAACMVVLRAVQASAPEWFTPACDAMVEEAAATLAAMEMEQQHEAVSGEASPPPPPPQRFPIILLDGLDGVGKTTVTRELAARLQYYPRLPPPTTTAHQLPLEKDAMAEGKVTKTVGTRLLNTPPPRFEAARAAFRRQPEAVARAFYCATNYLAAKDIAEAARTHVVVLDRWWTSTCAMACAAAATKRGAHPSSIPPVGDAVYVWPADLRPLPDSAFLLVVDEAVRRERALRRGALEPEEVALAEGRELREAATEAYRRTGRFTVIEDAPTWPLAVNAIATHLITTGILTPADVRLCTPEECAAVTPL